MAHGGRAPVPLPLHILAPWNDIRCIFKNVITALNALYGILLRDSSKLWEGRDIKEKSIVKRPYCKMWRHLWGIPCSEEKGTKGEGGPPARQGCGTGCGAGRAGQALHLLPPMQVSDLGVGEDVLVGAGLRKPITMPVAAQEQSLPRRTSCPPTPVPCQQPIRCISSNIWPRGESGAREMLFGPGVETTQRLDQDFPKPHKSKI